MTVYANYLVNPSFETNTATWTSPDGATLTRNTTQKQVGSYGLQVAVTTTSAQTKGIETTVPIDIGSGAFTLSGYVLTRAAQYDATKNTLKITLYDLVPGETASQKRQAATLTVTDVGRWALRNVTPRAGADRLVVRVAVGNAYYRAGYYSTNGPYTASFYGLNYSDYQAHYAAASSFANSKYNASISSSGSVGPSGTGDGYYYVTYYEQVWNPEIDGGSASNWIDALKLEQASTETAYADGDTPGYTWSGTPHASATLAIANAQAYGSADSTGSLGTHTVLFPTLSGTATSTGRLESILVGMSASGTNSSSGRLGLWQYGPMDARGSADSAGSLDIYPVIYVGADGSGASDGGVALDIAYPISLTGTACSIGSGNLTFPPELAASGSGSSLGSLVAGIAGQSQGHGTGSSIGLLDLAQAIPPGAFADFAVFDVSETDPLMSIRARSNGGTNTGANGAEWSRVYCDFVAPEDVASSDGALWKRAAYVVPGIRFENVAATNWQQFTMYQVEIAGANGPTLYRSANSLVPYVYPDRLNLAAIKLRILSNGVETLSMDWGDGWFPGDTVQAQFVDFPANNVRQVSTTYDTLRGNAWYTFSTYFYGSSDLNDLIVRVYDPTTGTQIGQSVTVEAPERGDPDTRRIIIVFRAPAHGGIRMLWEPQITQPQVSNVQLVVFGQLLEEGIDPKPYFYWREGNIDLWYRYGYSNASGGTFHYKDFARRSYLLKQALDESAPTGVIVEYPEFGKIPYLDN